jgi:hypothetical protein
MLTPSKELRFGSALAMALVQSHASMGAGMVSLSGTAVK